MSDEKQLLLLHGALADKSQFKSLIPGLKKQFEIHTINFEGHGDSNATDRSFCIEHFVENVLDYLSENSIEKTNIFGYSMGGYVALTLAKNHPQSVEKIATLGTIFQWEEEKAESECRYLDPDKIIEEVPHFAEKLDDRHQCGWKTMVNKTCKMLQKLGTKPNLTTGDWKDIQQSIRLHIGDCDTTAGLEPTVEVYQKIENAQLAVLPDTSHSFEKTNREKLEKSLNEFFIVTNKI